MSEILNQAKELLRRAIALLIAEWQKIYKLALIGYGRSKKRQRMLQARQVGTRHKDVPANGSRARREPIDIGAYGVLAAVVLPPFLLVFGLSMIPERQEMFYTVLNGPVQVSPARMAELNRTLDGLLPLFKLPNGKPLKRPTLTIEACGANISANEYDGDNRIALCGATPNYRHDRLVRVLKHELVHAWIAQSGIKDNFPHGREFMKKALEVGATPLDEP